MNEKPKTCQSYEYILPIKGEIFMKSTHSDSVFRGLTYIGAAGAFFASVWLLWVSKAVPIKNTAPVSAPATTSQASYYAALYDNQVVIYQAGQNTPIIITDIDVRTLPNTDRMALSQGIELETLDEVNRLVEDYSG